VSRDPWGLEKEPGQNITMWKNRRPRFIAYFEYPSKQEGMATAKGRFVVAITVKVKHDVAAIQKSFVSDRRRRSQMLREALRDAGKQVNDSFVVVSEIFTRAQDRGKP